MSTWLVMSHSSRGISAHRSRSIFGGSVFFVHPRRCAIRCTCVSTTTPSGAPNATPSTTFAVFRPTPGSATSSSSVWGTSPPCTSTSARAEPDDRLRLLPENPDPRPTNGSTSRTGRPPRARARPGSARRGLRRDLVHRHVGRLRRAARSRRGARTGSRGRARSARRVRRRSRASVFWTVAGTGFADRAGSFALFFAAFFPVN